jgi:acyl-CoA synthetase (AMP-forming)/AMP-acid ligase II
MFPDKTALVFKDRRLSYRELDEAANRLANALRGLGLDTGDRVADLQHNGIEQVVASMAAERAGLVFVRLHPAESLEVRDFILEHSEAKVLIMAAEFVEEWVKHEGGRGKDRIDIAVPSSDRPGVLSYDTLVAEASADDPEVMVSPADTWMLGYTSGTTGTPKGLLYTIEAMLARLRNDALNEDIVIDHHDVLLSFGPLIHAAGLVAQLCTFKGVTHIIMDRFDVEEILETIQSERVTAFWVVPTMLTRIVNHPRAEQYDVSSVRRIFYSSAPMSVEVLKRGIEIFGPTVFRQHYAVGEHPQPVALLYPEDHIVDGDPLKLKRLGSVGRVCLGSELKIVGDDGTEVGVDEPGEIWIRGDACMKEYWNNPEATAEAFTEEGWLRTGDMGEWDEGGYLYLVDRKQNMIISGGFNIYPREVERALEAHPAVFECCVFGIPDEEWGESVKAAVVLKPDAAATEDELISHCGERLARYKKPRSIDFVEDLPKSATGKILTREVRDPYWEGRAKKI